VFRQAAAMHFLLDQFLVTTKKPFYCIVAGGLLLREPANREPSEQERCKRRFESTQSNMSYIFQEDRSRSQQLPACVRRVQPTSAPHACP